MGPRAILKLMWAILEWAIERFRYTIINMFHATKLKPSVKVHCARLPNLIFLANKTTETT